MSKKSIVQAYRLATLDTKAGVRLFLIKDSQRLYLMTPADSFSFMVIGLLTT